MKIVLVTGGFDPLHSGHLSYINEAKRLGDRLIVGLNSDDWLKRKKGQYFMPWSERAEVMINIKGVNEVIDFNDDDGTASQAIHKVVKKYGDDNTIIFANGGDRTKQNIPEMSYFEDVKFVFGIGGNDKKNSSSWILDEYKNPKTKRSWGWYRVLDDKKTYKVKELVIEPGQSLSMQRHFKRAEHWYVLKGNCEVMTDFAGRTETVLLNELTKGYVIDKEVWHKATNIGKGPCHVLEVQYGSECVEEDIERKT